MIYYIRVINMASRYQFSGEEIKAIEQARRENKDKRAEARLKALERGPKVPVPRMWLRQRVSVQPM